MKMESACGYSCYHILKHKNALTSDVLVSTVVNNINDYNAESVKLYSAYTGKVSVNLHIDTSKSNYLLENKINIGGKEITIKVLDSKEHNLNQDVQYNLQELLNLKSMNINLNENVYKYYLILLISNKIAKQENRINDCAKIEIKIQNLKNDVTYPSIIEKVNKNYPDLLTDSTINTLSKNKLLKREFLTYNAPIDILFNVTNYLVFLYEKTGIVGVNNQNSLVCIANVNKLDNAFLTGSYMVFGNGDTQFYPLTSIDVIGHELTHGLIQGLPDLEYKAHSGALNESYADIVGTTFEFYI
jgi:Zn-dependent metalloprotease